MDLRSPIRKKFTGEIRVFSAPQKVFPLLCPVRERDWVPEWNPKEVYSSSGFAELHATFVTVEPHGEAVWTVIEYESEKHLISFLKVVPAFVVVRIEIDIKPYQTDHSILKVSYQFSAISDDGEKYVSSYSKADYQSFMRHWEVNLNTYLKGG